MNPVLTPPDLAWPDHTQLPETDGSIVDNSAEFPQGVLLTDSLTLVLERLHPDGHYFLGLDCGIYWTYVAEEPLQGCKSPDWYYVPNVAPMPPGTIRRSYVLWREQELPRVVLEFVSGDGSEEHDATPETGKFWVYEQAIRAAYYGIFDAVRATLEVYQLVNGRYQRMAPNAHGRYFLPPLGVELGMWQAFYATLTLPWLRWWDAEGQMLLTGREKAEQEREAKELAERQTREERQAKEQAERQTREERQAKDQAVRQAEDERRAREQAEQQTRQVRQEANAAVEQAKRLAEKLRALGVDPDA